MIFFHKKWKKHYEIQLTKNKMDLNNRKMKNHPSSTIPRDKIHCNGNWSIRKQISLPTQDLPN